MLPVTQIFPALNANLDAGNAIVVAPPGAGKSTALPLYLLKMSRFANSKIIMLQPRRVAARNIALYLAKQLGEEVGRTVGYRVRGENKTSAATRLEIVTEGILTRMLQSSPELPGVGLVIFDEFHERSVHADFSLALCLEVQQALRDDLPLLVMSATLDIEALQKVLPDVPILESTGRAFPVDIQHIEKVSKLPITTQIKNLVLSVFRQHQHDILVFLPGAFEIKKTAAELASALGEDAAIHMLFSELKKEQQQDAILPDPHGKRKIVLATNIAETSLTIEGIEVVVDSGIEKRAIFDVRRGITQLTTQKISQASATQRAGRAGRLMPGTCYRLWPKEQHHRLARQSAPEILQTDLSGFVLEASIWGSAIEDLILIDCPTPAQVQQAQNTLRLAGLLDNGNKATKLGRDVNRLGGNVHVAAMLFASEKLGVAQQSLACAIAALLESKDPLPNSGSVELYERLMLLKNQSKHSIWPLVRQWHAKLGIELQPWPLEDIGLLLGLGFGQWIAKQTAKGRFLLANGSGASLGSSQHHAQSHDSNHAILACDWVVVCNMQITDKQSDNALIRYAQGITLETLQKHFPDAFTERKDVVWDMQKQKISASLSRHFGSIQVSNTPLGSPPKDRALLTWKGLLETKLAKDGLAAIPLDFRSKQLIVRVELARAFLNKSANKTPLPDLSAAGLRSSIYHWLLPYLEDKTSWQQLINLPFYQLLSNLLNYQQLSLLEELLPENWLIPTGRKAALEYSEQGTATLSVRMQEMYGLQKHPVLLNGSLAITCELLSPAQRPLQTTQDIVGFWAGSYVPIQKEMKGRYPRHFWPDDPAHAKATAATKKKM
ncbi:ATP-dependent helicase HrpB [Glaciecola sp. SC05]|uniref:ATP-dependent helicase HrpB n=1 Tax=Glaciecola sp. SC05 TaxID=1987355 RepID=UPI003528C8CE